MSPSPASVLASTRGAGFHHKRRSSNVLQTEDWTQLKTGFTAALSTEEVNTGLLKEKGKLQEIKWGGSANSLRLKKKKKTLTIKQWGIQRCHIFYSLFHINMPNHLYRLTKKSRIPSNSSGNSCHCLSSLGLILIKKVFQFKCDFWVLISRQSQKVMLTMVITKNFWIIVFLTWSIKNHVLLAVVVSVF